MTSVTLGPIFDRPLHPAPWCNYGRDRGKGADCPRYDYRVTNTFDGPDLVNGGLHRATDVGNAATNHPLLAPADGLGRGLRHTDGALGYEQVLGGVVTFEAWHLNRVDVPPTWTPVTRGQRVGLTGATGGRLQDGRPMPAHTHIAGKRDGLPFDIEPHLVMPERPAQPILIEESDMLLKGRFLRHVSNRQGTITADASFRAGVLAGDNERLHVLPEGERFVPIAVVEGDPAGTDPDAREWYAGVKTSVGPTPIDPTLGYVHSSLLPRTPDGSGVALQLIEAADCTAQDNRIAAARTAVDGAAQAIAAAQRSLA